MSGGDNKQSLWRLCTEGVFDVLFPKYCLVCRQEGSYCCVNCQRGLQPIYPRTCFGCHHLMPYGATCTTCQLQYSFDGVIISADYDETLVGQLVKLCKYRFVKELGEIMGWLVAEKLRQLLERSEKEHLFDRLFFQSAVVPIPLSSRRLRQREFNQADIISRFVSHYFSLPYYPTWLGRRHTKVQATLSEEKRKHNLEGSFFVKEAPATLPELVLVVDDVITTGATLNEAARVLKESGVKTVWGLIVAKG